MLDRHPPEVWQLVFTPVNSVTSISSKNPITWYDPHLFMCVKRVTGYNSRPGQCAALQARLKGTWGMQRVGRSHLIDLFFFVLFEVVSWQREYDQRTIQQPLGSETSREQTEDMLDYLGFYPYLIFYMFKQQSGHFAPFSNEFGGKGAPCVDSPRSLRSLPLPSLPPVSSPFNQMIRSV